MANPPCEVRRTPKLVIYCGPECDAGSGKNRRTRLSTELLPRCDEFYSSIDVIRSPEGNLPSLVDLMFSTIGDGARDCPHDVCVIWCMPECWDQSGQKLVDIPEASEYLSVAKEYFANFPHLLLIAPGDTSWHTGWTEKCAPYIECMKEFDCAYCTGDFCQT